MEKEFIDYTEAIALKELGFDEPCFKVVEGGPTDIFPYEKLDVPIYQQAFRWFRENHNLQHELCSCIKNSWLITIMDTTSTTEHGVYNGKRWDCDDLDENIPHTYEEAELACLKKLIEIVKNSYGRYTI